MKIVKQFALENGDTISLLVFFFIVAFAFFVVVIHALKMKRSTVEELANLTLKNDDTQ